MNSDVTEISQTSSLLGADPGLQFGDLLVQRRLITPEDLQRALAEQRKSGGRLGEVLLRLEVIDDSTLTNTLAEHLAIERVNLEDLTTVDTRIARMVPEAIAKRFCLVAIGEEGDKLVVAMADPLDVFAIDTVVLKVQRPIKPTVSSSREINRAIDLLYHSSDIEERQLRDLIALEADTEEGPTENVQIEEMPQVDAGGEEAANQAPVIRFVGLLLKQAVKNRASDIHIEPQANTTVVRMRVDGLLREMVPPPKRMQAAVVARIKILAQMNIAERRLPQDGRLRIRTSGRDIDVRVSTIPTIYGEKVVMRILDACAVNHDLYRLGLEPEALLEFRSMLSRPHGIIVVTGPTGSGKSTTLYAALNYLKDPAVNITTVEDPVEYRLAGINQIQVKPEIGLDFARCLRAILRQDPDVVLIGEMRDKETVDIAIKASLTGHLVLSTFHTNDAPSTISRLTHMGVERYLLASTLNLIMAQRLVRKICDHCREPVEATEDMLRRLRIDPEQARDVVFQHGKGCSACGETGYVGRLPIFEFLVVDGDIAERIVDNQSEAQIREAARQKGFGGLLENGVRAVLRGQTTAEEVLRVASTVDK
ncbi:MAG: Flp pilus assembly complex ATPase component TadA [Sedimentisphaerales bacterium]|nr:Flp pilus assembly complex ATPase component TadA [Sedimentisphaerales bacterium]